MDYSGVDNDPAGAAQALQHDEGDGADETANSARQSFAIGSRLKGFAFNLHNLVDVLSDRRRCPSYSTCGPRQLFREALAWLSRMELMRRWQKQVGG